MSLISQDVVVKGLAEKLQTTQKEAKEILGLVAETYEEIGLELAAGEKLKVLNFLQLEVVHTEEKEARNPATGEALVIPAQDRPKVKVLSKFKNAFKPE